MDKLLKAQLETSEKRTALAALLDAEAPDEAAIETAKNDLTASEKRMQAVMVLDGGNKETRLEAGDSEGREIRGLVKAASVGRMLAGIMAEGEGDGPDKELRDALGIPEDYIPLALLERRAALTTSGNEPANPVPMVQRVFPPSAAAFVGLDLQTVPVGQQAVPACDRRNHSRAVYRLHRGNGDDRGRGRYHLAAPANVWQFRGQANRPGDVPDDGRWTADGPGRRPPKRYRR